MIKNGLVIYHVPSQIHSPAFPALLWPLEANLYIEILVSSLLLSSYSGKQGRD